jgi:hypothetical protein
MQSIPVRNLFTIYFESTHGEVDLHLESNDNFFGLAFGDRRVEMKLYYRGVHFVNSPIFNWCK